MFWPKNFKAGIAQLVEQRTENPRVTSSSLVPGIVDDQRLARFGIKNNKLHKQFYNDTSYKLRLIL